jgi:hypothetical protein
VNAIQPYCYGRDGDVGRHGGQSGGHRVGHVFLVELGSRYISGR